MQMFGMHNLQKFKNHYLIDKYTSEMDDDIEAVKNIDNDNFKSMITQCGSSSKAGKSVNNPLKPNQDRFIQRPNFIINEFQSTNEAIIDQTHLFGVLDGHGIDGHKISGALKSKLPVIIKTSMNPIPESLQQMLIEAVTKVDKEINQSLAFNSGST